MTGKDTSDTETADEGPAGRPCRGTAPDALARPGRAGRPAVFIDRDGTLIEEAHYLTDPSGLRLVPGAADALRALRKAGYVRVVVTNQSAVGRGMISEARLAEVHQELRRQLGADAAVDAIYFCPDAPPADGDPDAGLAPRAYRKPGAGMFLRAAAELGLDLARSWSVGDMLRDLQAAHRAGCAGNLLVLTGKGRTQTELAAASGVPHEVVDDLPAAAARIVDGPGPIPERPPGYTST